MSTTETSLATIRRRRRACRRHRGGTTHGPSGSATVKHPASCLPLVRQTGAGHPGYRYRRTSIGLARSIPQRDLDIPELDGGSGIRDGKRTRFDVLTGDGQRRLSIYPAGKPSAAGCTPERPPPARHTSFKMSSAIVIGAGMGGLSGAIHLARNGFDVNLFEARAEAGGLASGVEYEGFKFDAGPYILLDRPGLEWSFERLGLQLSQLIPLHSIESIYSVETMNGVSVDFHADLDKTSALFEKRWPGSGDRYKQFVGSMNQLLKGLQPMLQTSRPGPLELFRTGSWRHAPFLIKTLQ